VGGVSDADAASEHAGRQLSAEYKNYDIVGGVSRIVYTDLNRLFCKVLEEAHIQSWRWWEHVNRLLTMKITLEREGCLYALLKRSASFPTDVKDVVILVANSFSRGPAYYQTGFSGTCRTRIVLISEFATSINIRTISRKVGANPTHAR
jgi:hypothetical protein